MGCESDCKSDPLMAGGSIPTIPQLLNTYSKELRMEKQEELKDCKWRIIQLEQETWVLIYVINAILLNNNVAINSSTKQLLDMYTKKRDVQLPKKNIYHAHVV